MNSLSRRRLDVIIVAAVCLVTFGLYIPRLGFYLDDWTVLAAARLYHADGLWQFFFLDARPTGAWTYQLLLPVLGYQPLHWQIFTLSLRCLTSIALWGVLRAVWPEKRFIVTSAAILFAVSSVFTQQSTAVTFHQAWLQYLLFFLSLFFMLLSVHQPSRGWLWTLLSLLTILVSFTISEYFVSVEIIRPVLLWLVIGSKANWKIRMKEALLRWLPYLALLGLFIFWRLFLMEVPVDRNSPQLLFQLVLHPRYAAITLSRLAVQDLFYVLIYHWYASSRSLFDSLRFSTPGDPIWIALAITVIPAAYLAWTARNDEEAAGRRWALTAILVGIIVVAFGGIPGWVIGKQAASTLGAYNDRFALVPMFGASLFLAGLIDLLSGPKEMKALVLALFMLVSIRMDLIHAQNYAASWSSQKELYWELSWRAPTIQPGTVLFTDHENFRYMGSWATASALNVMYPQPVRKPKDHQYVGFWYLNAYKVQDKIEDFRNGMELFYRHNNLVIDAASTESIGFYKASDKPSCLWILSPYDVDNPLLPDILQTLAPVSRVDKISPDQPAGNYPPVDMIGQEPSRSWCYYFAKADLARQLRQWDRIPTLWETARAKGQHPFNGMELVPFIEGFGYMDQWDQSLELSYQAQQLTPQMQRHLCKTWKRIERETPETAARISAVKSFRANAKCE